MMDSISSYLPQFNDCNISCLDWKPVLLGTLSFYLCTTYNFVNTQVQLCKNIP